MGSRWEPDPCSVMVAQLASVATLGAAGVFAAGAWWLGILPGSVLMLGGALGLTVLAWLAGRWMVREVQFSLWARSDRRAEVAEVLVLPKRAESGRWAA